MPTRNLILWLCLIGVCLAQTSAPVGPAVSAYLLRDGSSVYAESVPGCPLVNGVASGDYRWLRIDPPLRLTWDTGVCGPPHLGIAPFAPNIAPGPGIAMVTVPNSPTQVMVDDAVVAVRAAVPAQSGVCAAGTGSWAADQSYFYFCVPNGAGNGFVWARTQLSTSW
jgi:hypothetical protein